MCPQFKTSGSDKAIKSAYNALTFRCNNLQLRECFSLCAPCCKQVKIQTNHMWCDPKFSVDIKGIKSERSLHLSPPHPVNSFHPLSVMYPCRGPGKTYRFCSFNVESCFYLFPDVCENMAGNAEVFPESMWIILKFNPQKTIVHQLNGAYVLRARGKQ